MSIFINDIGTIIRLKVMNKVLTSGVNPRIYYESPLGTKGFWDATIEGTDTLQRIVQSGDFFEEGNWKIQGYIELPGWAGFSTIETIRIDKDLSV